MEPPEALNFSYPLYGKETFEIPAGKTYKCIYALFVQRFVGSNVFVQLAPSRSSSMTRPLHQAVTVWLEWVNATGFSACVETSGPSGDLRVSATPNFIVRCKKKKNYNAYPRKNEVQKN